MKTPTDIEIAKQLEQLAQTIEIGIKSADEILVKAQQIRTEVHTETEKLTSFKSELLQIYNEVKSTSVGIENFQSDFQTNLNIANQFHHDVELHQNQIKTYEHFVTQLNQELINIRFSLETAQTQLENFEQQIPALNQRLPQHLDEIKQIEATINRDQIQLQELIQTNQTQIQQAAHTNAKSQEILQNLENIFTQIGGQHGLEKIQQEYENNHKNIQNAYLEMERLQTKLDTQIKKQNFLKIWLLTLSISFAVILAITLLK